MSQTRAGREGHFPLGLPRSEQLMGLGDLVGRERPGPADMLAAFPTPARGSSPAQTRPTPP